MRWLFPLFVAFSVSWAPAVSARADEVELRIVSGSLRSAGGSALSSAGVTWIDFGQVTVAGRDPRVPERHQVQDGGGSHFVASFEVEVVATRDWISSPPTGYTGRPTGSRPGLRVDKRVDWDPSRPATGRSTAGPVDLYAALDGGGVQDGSVRLAVGWSPDWAASADAGQALGPEAVPVAWGLRPGDRVHCELSLYASPRTSGPQEATVRFTVR